MFLILIEIRIGFELPDYTYNEPLFEEFIDAFYVSPTGRPENGPIFLVKENNVTSEQTFLVFFQAKDSAPSSAKPATVEEDYRFTSQSVFFEASRQRIPFTFSLQPDFLPEGTEGFQASVSYIWRERNLRYPISLNPISLASEIFITIIDDDRKFQLRACSFVIQMLTG